MNHKFRDLQIWQDGIKNATFTYNSTSKFPREELFGISAQMRRAAVSIPSNIAEGCGRGTDIQLMHFLDIALGSAFELETQVLIVKELGYTDSKIVDNWIENLQSIQKRIKSFKNTLKAKSESEIK